MLENEDWLTHECKLTEKSKAFLEEIDQGLPDKPVEDLADFISAYTAIWPNIKIPTSGKRARVHPTNLEVAFKWFFQRYEYSQDVILRATNVYVNDCELQGYNYMRTSQFFIRKQNPDKSWTSDLADYCESIVSGGEEENLHHFSQNVD